MKSLQFLMGYVFVIPVSIWILLRGVMDYLLQRVFLYICRCRATQESTSDRFDLVCISHVLWDNRCWQRNHHIMSRLAEKHSVFYCHPNSVLDILTVINDFFSYKRENKRVHIYNPLLLIGQNKIPLMQTLNRFIISNSIKKMVYKNRLLEKDYRKEIVLWFFFPKIEYIIGHLNESMIVYDIQDEYAAFPWAPKDIKEKEEKLITVADLIFTGTHSLYKKKAKYGKSCYFMPCGVDREHFESACLESTIIPQDIIGIKGPIIGYFGSIDERIDMQLLEYMAEGHPEWSIVMLGPVREWADSRPEQPNIHFLGEVDYRILPRYLKAFDVCMIPFKMTALALHTNPTKLLEYLAGGKPVVTTDIPDMSEFYTGIVELARSQEDFVRATAGLLHRPDKARVARGQDIARGRSWEALVAKMEEHIWASIEHKGRVAAI